MKFLFLSFSLFLTCLLSGKVYDCFPFFNELELLKIRLDELNDVVDYFVLVESVETQRGNPKPLYFEENKALFSQYLHKIIHVVVNERHPEFTLWERENFQRNAILRGLKHCKNRDVIVISDLDEIPRPHLIPYIATNLKRRRLKGKPLKAIAFEMKMFRFQLNRDSGEKDPWMGTVATTYKHLKERTPQYFRDKRGQYFRFKEGGWHFTWMGGREKVRTKMLSVVEGSDDVSALSDESIDAMIASFSIVPLGPFFPRYILNHQEELKAIGYLALPQE